MVPPTLSAILDCFEFPAANIVGSRPEATAAERWIVVHPIVVIANDKTLAHCSAPKSLRSNDYSILNQQGDDRENLRTPNRPFEKFHRIVGYRIPTGPTKLFVLTIKGCQGDQKSEHDTRGIIEVFSPPAFAFADRHTN